MFHLFPISQPNIDWTFIQKVTDALGRSPTETMDRKGLGLKRKLPDFLSLMKEITLPKSDPLNHAGRLMEHMSFSFGMLTTRTSTYDILNHCGLTFTTVQSRNPDFYLTVLSGTLGTWERAILNCCVDGVSTEVRTFGTQVLTYFDTLGLKTFMVPMTKVPLGDGTLRLTAKD